MRNDFDLKGKKQRYAHLLGADQWEYNNELAHLGGFEPLPEFYKKGAQIWLQHRALNVLHYKESNLIIDDEGTIKIEEPKETRTIHDNNN